MSRNILLGGFKFFLEAIFLVADIASARHIKKMRSVETAIYKTAIRKFR
jgi:hypothetical protein